MVHDSTPKDNALAEKLMYEQTGKKMSESKVCFISKENTQIAEAIGVKVDQICRDFDPYEYNDMLVGTKEENIEEVKQAVLYCRSEHIVEGLEAIYDTYKETLDNIAGDLTDDGRTQNGVELSDSDKRTIEETQEAMNTVRACIDEIKAYNEKYQLWNDNARSEFPTLSFLMTDFEMGIYPTLEPSTDGKYEFYKIVEQFADLERQMTGLTFAYNTDEMMSLCETKNDLEKVTSENKEISEAVKKWFEGNFVDYFYNNAGENAKNFREALDGIFDKYEKMVSFGKGDVKVQRENKQTGKEV
jgi:hypothetical protein